MAKRVRKKAVYRALATGRLIPKKIAEQQDPTTWVREERLEFFDPESQTIEFRAVAGARA